MQASVSRLIVLGAAALPVVLAVGTGACGSRPAQLPGTGGSGSAATGGTAGGQGDGGAAAPGSGGAGGGAGTGGRGGVTATGGAGIGGGAAGAAGAPVACAGGGTFDYLVSAITTQERTAGDAGAPSVTRVHGFDLDGRDSDGTKPEDCGRADYADADGRGGIDNTIAGFWAEDFGSAFRAWIAAGELKMQVRLSGVDNFQNDGCIDVTWSNRALPPSTGGAGDSGQAQFRRARIEAGRVVIAGGDSSTVLIGNADVRLGTFSGGAVFPLAQPRIAFRASAQVLTAGVVGGTLTGQSVLNAYFATFGPSIPQSILADVIVPDLPMGGQLCALLSAGFGFEAAAATTSTGR